MHLIIWYNYIVCILVHIYALLFTRGGPLLSKFLSVLLGTRSQSENKWLWQTNWNLVFNYPHFIVVISVRRSLFNQIYVWPWRKFDFGRQTAKPTSYCTPVITKHPLVNIKFWPAMSLLHHRLPVSYLPCRGCRGGRAVFLWICTIWLWSQWLTSGLPLRVWTVNHKMPIYY